jgi:hypothetical protein
VGGEIFRTCPNRARGPPSLLYNGYWIFLGVKSGRGVTLTPQPLLVPLIMKEQSYTSTPPMGRTACTEPQCMYSRAIPLLPLRDVRLVQSLSACTVELYLYPPMGRTGCTESQCLYSRAIPLLPLWDVRAVQSLSACTRVTFIFNLLRNIQIFKKQCQSEFLLVLFPISSLQAN